VWERGRFTTIDDKDADVTSAFGINELGEIVGATANVDAAGNLTALHGFVRNWRGRVTTIDAPGALGTAASAIDNRGRVVGFSYDEANVAHGFVASRGRFRTLDAPGGTFAQLASINDRGQIVVSSDAMPPTDCVS
jgi:uncharacterized membrane protein